MEYIYGGENDYEKTFVHNILIYGFHCNNNEKPSIKLIPLHAASLVGRKNMKLVLTCDGHAHPKPSHFVFDWFWW